MSVCGIDIHFLRYKWSINQYPSLLIHQNAMFDGTPLVYLHSKKFQVQLRNEKYLV